MIPYDEREIAQVFARIPCIKCDSWHAGVVMAKVLAFLVAHWDGERNIKPPSQIRRFRHSIPRLAVLHLSRCLGPTHFTPFHHLSGDSHLHPLLGARLIAASS